MKQGQRARRLKARQWMDRGLVRVETRRQLALWVRANWPRWSADTRRRMARHIEDHRYWLTTKGGGNG